MLLEVVISFITLAVIIAFVVWLAMQPQKRIVQITIPVCLIGFVIIYAFYLVAYLVPDEPVFGIPAAFSAFVETFGSFTNGVAYSDVAESDRVMEVFGAFWFETLFWALHMLVIICLAITGFAVFGRKFMDKMRLRLYRGFRGKDIFFIFGDSNGALVLGRNIAKENPHALVVFFSEDYTEELREDIAEFGGALIEVNEASRDEQLEKARAQREENIAVFEGDVIPRVNEYDIADLLARYVVKVHPPYKVMDIPKDSSRDPLENIPTRPYAALIVGFGEVGRACLKQLIMASQFTVNGSLPQFTVISRDRIAFERFCLENPAINQCAKIDFFEADIFSFEAHAVMERVVQDGQAPLRQVYVCCAPVVALDPQERCVHVDSNEGVDAYIKEMLGRLGWYADDSKGALKELFINPCVEEEKIWTPEIVLHKELDRRAMQVAIDYLVKEKGKSLPDATKEVQEEWSTEGDAENRFTKDSNRSAAAFMEAYFELIGVDPANRERLLKAQAMLKARPDVLDALGHIEHDRWNAFHYCHGFTPMSEKELNERKQMEPLPPKPHRDFLKKRHICLVPWDELPVIDGWQRQPKGEYQSYDRENVNTAAEYLIAHLR